ncbi:ATP-binding cassette domain-containing protein [Leucobacter aridicollis]|uniref:Peptide/nickel transport system ATP-binding protein n=1 Tax=Leucobacter aridicollis TaxID=283878 RepID=A0A852R5K7_9MICO|nr:ATP-binding cassette domain-containing protein [Leucobacter aridicollis]MBL3680900.1 ABC transporter ATP-binding protein [Leucobacter aridicollis]NYD28097.1 peptide/nickel transport system ATP-binding protein [Leucobacter aridicollis]
MNATAKPLLRATNLVKEFNIPGTGGLLRKPEVFRAVDDVSLEVYPGETLALVGESGSGKSTTARLIARLMSATSGEIEFDGRDVSQISGKELHEFRSDVQVIFQDPYSSLNPRHTVERLVTAPLLYQNREVPGGPKRYTQDLMARVGLNPDHSTRYPWQFSGGQAQRIGIARALAVRPRLVVADEAVSALDVSVQAQVINLLKKLQREEGFSYLFIAHDLAVVRQIADRLAVMNSGRIVEMGERDQIFGAPQDPYTQRLLGAVPRIRPEWDAARRENDRKRHLAAAAASEAAAAGSDPLRKES